MPLSHRLRPTVLLPLAVAGAIAVAGCGSDDDSGGSGASTSGGGSVSAVNVVATTTVLGDLAREIGGEGVEVTQLLQPNSDPHDYEPRPDDVVATARASLVLESGDGLDAWIGDVVEQSGGDPELVDVAETLPVQREGGDHGHAEEAGHAEEEPGHAEGEEHAAEEPGHAEGEEAGHAEGDEPHAEDEHDHGSVDPHWWHDPTNVEAAAATVREALTRANPEAGDLYARNADAYVAKVRALDRGIRQCLDAVPAAQRKLVTDHDALGYFADRYDVEIVGAVIPALTTQAQPSAGDVAELARVIRREGVRAVFPESGSNRKLPEAVAKETGVTAEYQLYGDALGPEGSDAATYLGMEAHNADAIVRGLTGGASGCTIEGI